MQIGSKIRDLRSQMGLTQEELADRTELSKSFISQLERDLTSPSIATLCDILQCLGTNLADFFNDTREDPVVFSKNDFFTKTNEELHHTIQWIVPSAQKHSMEPILMTLEAEGSSPKDDPHAGEEFGYVLSGSITLHIGTSSFRIKKGESFYFLPQKQHYISSRKGATLIWVSSPPSF